VTGSRLSIVCNGTKTLVFSIISLFANMDERLSLARAYEINEV
jgi:hypothetical protein